MPSLSNGPSPSVGEFRGAQAPVVCTSGILSRGWCRGSIQSPLEARMHRARSCSILLCNENTATPVQISP